MPDYLKRTYLYLVLAGAYVIYLVTRLVNLKSVPVFVDEAIYVNWSQMASRGIHYLPFIDGKPPGHSLAMMPFLKIFSDPLYGSRFMSVAFGLLTLTGIVLIGREIGGLKLGAFAGLLWSLCAYALWYERMGLAESMLVALMVIAVFFAVKAVQSVNYYYLIGTGLFIGFAMWTKPTAQLLYLVVPFAFLVRGTEQKGKEGSHPLLRWLGCIALADLAGFGIYNLMRISSHFAAMVKRLSVWTVSPSQLLHHPFGLVPANLRNIVSSLWSGMTPLLFIVCLLGILVGLLRSWRPAWFLTAWLIIMLVVISMVSKNAGSRYWTGLLPPLILGGGYAVTELPLMAVRAVRRLKKEKLQSVLVPAVVVVVIALTVVMLVPVGKTIADDVSVSDPAKVSLGRWSWGWGYDQVVKAVQDQIKKGPVDVATFDFFSSIVMRMYFRGEKNVKIIKYRPDGVSNAKYMAQVHKTLTLVIRKGKSVFIVANDVPINLKGWKLTTYEVYPKDASKKIVLVFAGMKGAQ